MFCRYNRKATFSPNVLASELRKSRATTLEKRKKLSRHSNHPFLSLSFLQWVKEGGGGGEQQLLFPPLPGSFAAAFSLGSQKKQKKKRGCLIETIAKKFRPYGSRSEEQMGMIFIKMFEIKVR